MSIVVKPGGEVLIVVPNLFHNSQEYENRIKDFIARKESWVARAVARMKKIKPQIALGHGRADYKMMRKEAEKFVRRRVPEINNIYGFKYRRLIIRNQKTRWGSCSLQGNLSFNYRIVRLPPELADYLIVHELCHLQELNHSKSFWNLVAKTMPNPKIMRRALAKYSLHG
jgi:hypothetical protein